MSIELPEARILAQQLDQTITGKTIKEYDLKDVERMIKIGFFNKDLSEFKPIKDKKVIGATSRGNTIRVQLSDEMNILIGPEYGGVLTYLEEGDKVPKFHLKLVFDDGSILTTRITSMGLVYAVPDNAITENYMYNRDFLGGVSPDEPGFNWEWFRETMGNENKQIKPLLVGKDAHIIGVSNATFQDVIYRAKIHPKRRASDLSEDELHALYKAIKTVVTERLEKNGKAEFTDIYGVQGGYEAAMGPNMKDQKCPSCGSEIEKLAHGGGSVYLCPNCQRE
jgi:formamidopyrimidine-DNA glycosylase